MAAEAKKCPKCRLINPPETETCDCGYNFTDSRGGAVKPKLSTGFKLVVLCVIPALIIGEHLVNGLLSLAIYWEIAWIFILVMIVLLLLKIFKKI